MRRCVLPAVHEPLIVEEAADLQPAAGEVVVELAAAALNHRDVWISKGLYPGVTFPCTPGSDGAGVVTAVGAGVDPAVVGREVIINPATDWGDSERAQDPGFTILGVPTPGTLASQVVVRADAIHDCPAHLSLADAAALPLAGLTAWRALTSRGGAESGETVLISGVGGGVALFALQFAVALGCRVIATSSSADKRARALELGAAAAYNYTEDRWADVALKETGGVDLVIDGAAGSALNPALSLCRPGGRIVLYGGTAGLPDELNVRSLFWKQIDIRGTTMGSPADFSAMVQFVTKNQIQPVIDRRFTLNQVNEAFAHMDAGQQFGKILVTLET